jgi:hypothetical protein
LGQKRTYAVQKGMSALPPIATMKADPRLANYDLSTRLSLTSGTSLREPLSIQTTSANAPCRMASTRPP